MITELGPLTDVFKNLFGIVKTIKDLKQREHVDDEIKSALEKVMRIVDTANFQAERLAKLEEEVRQLKDFNREAQRYQLSEIGPGVYAYATKRGCEGEEPPHYLCANCFANREKSILQLRSQGMGIKTFICHRCRSDFRVDSGLSGYGED